jgi:hypothetical protein
VIPGLVADEILQKGPDDIAAKALQRTGLFTSVPAPEIDPSVGLWNLGRVSKSRMRYVVNPHVRIRGGPGRATGRVYPIRQEN